MNPSFPGENPESVALDFARDYISHLSELLQNLDLRAVTEVIHLFCRARDNGNTIFFLGNGGSAATADHFANDLCVSASPEGEVPFKAVSLASNVSLLSCIANDYGYEEAFRRQLMNLLCPGDVVVGISASGNSPNAVKALEYAAERGAVPVAIVGFDGGRMKKVATHVIHIKSRPGEYGPVEDTHLVLDHLITQYLRFVSKKRT